MYILFACDRHYLLRKARTQYQRSCKYTYLISADTIVLPNIIVNNLNCQFFPVMVDKSVELLIPHWTRTERASK